MLQGARLKMETLLAQVEDKERQLNRLKEEQESETFAEKSVLNGHLEEKNNTIKKLDLEVENLKMQITQLQTEVINGKAVLDESIMVWKQQVGKSMNTLLAHLQNFPHKNPPAISEIFDREILLDNLGGQAISQLSAKADLLFYLMLALMKLQPYASAETFDLKDANDLAAKVISFLQIDQLSTDAPDWISFQNEVGKKADFARGIKWDLTDVVDKEIFDMQATIEEAAASLEKLMLEARNNEQSKPNIDVDMKILDSCSKLFAAIQEVVKNGRKLQNEITSESVALGTNSRPEFYRKNQKWSEGLVSGMNIVL